MKKHLTLEYWRTSGQFYCHLKSGNGQILLVSEGYKRYAGVYNLYLLLTNPVNKLALRARHDIVTK